jgi:hypothetical protein
MRKTTLGTLSLIVSTFLVGCGSSSSSSNDNSDDLLTGYFIDSAVANIDYTTSSGLSGTTNRNGEFKYQSGDRVKLKIGNLLLGEAEPKDDGLITPETLTTNDAEKILLLRTLQTLDVDKNLSNGIIVNPSVAQSLKDINETSIVAYNEDELIQLIDQGDKKILDYDYDGVIDVTEGEALSHFDNSMKSWEEGERTVSSENGNGNENGHQNEDESCEENNSTDESHGNEFNLSNYPVTSTLTIELKNSLAYMGNEERLAYDVYHNLYNYHVDNNNDEIKQLENISEKSEIKHVGIVQDLVQRYKLGAEDVTNVINPVANRDVKFEDMPSGTYDIPAIQELYDILYAKGISSRKDALMVGCMVEVTDVDDLDKYILLAEASKATDVIEAFNVLRDGSYNHYWAFDKGLKNIGIENGCYVKGDALLGENKDGIYPTNDNHGEEEGSENGNGNGNTDREGNNSTDESHGNGNGNGNGNGRN